jgi:hypothetical protein
MRADDIAEGIELWRGAKGESAEGGLKQQKHRRDKRGRHAPSSQPDTQRKASPRNASTVTRTSRPENRQNRAAATRRDTRQLSLADVA